MMRTVVRSVILYGLIMVSPSLQATTPAFQVLDMLAGDNDQARAQARQLLPREGVEIVPRLVTLLGSDNDAVRLTAFNVLADLTNQVSVPGREADRAKVTADLLPLVAGDQPAKLKEMGLRLLPLVAPEGANIAPMVALLDDAELQEKARAALVEMGTVEARAGLREYLPRAQPDFACALLDGLGQLKDGASLPMMVELLKHENPAVRVAAARALAWTGDPTHLGAVQIVLSRCDEATRCEAVDAWLRLVRAIETNGGNWQIAMSEYVKMIASPESKVRLAGLAGLGRMGDGSCVMPILAAIDKAEPVEWAAGIEALRQMAGVDVCREIAHAYASIPARTQIALLPILGQKQHASALPILRAAAEDENPAFRTVALSALGKSGLPEAIEPLEAACTAVNPGQQAVARTALVELGDALRLQAQAEAAGRAYLAALAGSRPDDKAMRRRAVAGLIASPRPEAFEVAKAVTADVELGDLAVPLLMAVGDKLVQTKDKDKAVQLYQAAVDLKPDTPTLRVLAEKLLRVGKPMDWAAQLGIVRQWWLVGPFALGEQNIGWSKPYIDEPNVNLKGRYMADKRRHEWRPAIADDQRGVVNMAAVLGQVDNAVGYAYAEIEVPAATDAVLRIGADDSERVWVNGEQVFELWAARGLTIDQDRVPVKLKAGVNSILMKVWQNTMGWEFCLRVTTSDDKAVSFTQKPVKD